VSIVFYVSGHGFGHASRVIEVINAVRARRPDLDVIVRTTAPRWLFERTVHGGVRAAGSPRARGGGVDYIRTETDTGVVQIDSLHLDAAASVDAARAFMASFDRRVEDEAAFLRDASASLVVADIPPLAFAAAARAGLPAVGLGNFTWDWIYSAYPDTADVVAAIGRAYSTAAAALRLPMHGGFATFDRIVDLPFVARTSHRDPRETRRALDLPLDDTLVLASFGGYGVDGLDLEALGRLDGYVAVLTASVPLGELPADLRHGRRGSLCPLDEARMYAAGFRYEDLVRAVDVVITKPGYGIIAECLANDTALLYTSRGDFIEYQVLVDAMPRFLRAAYIDQADVFGGRWHAHLDRLLAQPAPPERPATNGAAIAADLLLQRL
jgi:L-arabinokinase